MELRLFVREPRVFARRLMIAAAITLRAPFGSPLAPLESLDPGLISDKPPACLSAHWFRHAL
jgi:hypothetical protein